ncbi:unnamed protein product [Dracunculus medinensis]|uniref:UPF0587 protein C1orf123 homolog n=1 Tax=Dracunculus medinensis TaxID=318479 RepID=A0A0N4U0J2_DRAME|nr:unnamed protein product [Dracunculus medinensis]
MKASLVNITELQPADVENFRWHFQLKCTNCGEKPDHWQYAIISETMEVPGGRGLANIVIKCKLCERVNTLRELLECIFTTVIVQRIICRSFSTWLAKSTQSNTVFDDIDLTEKVYFTEISYCFILLFSFFISFDLIVFAYRLF